MVKLNITPIPNNTTRKLRARWTPEVAQDLRAYHGIDIAQDFATNISIMNMPDDVKPGDMLRLLLQTMESFGAVNAGKTDHCHVLFMSGHMVDAYVSDTYDLYGPRHRVDIVSRADE